MKNRLLVNFSQAFVYPVPGRAFRARTDLSGRRASILPIRYSWFRAEAPGVAGV